MNLTQEITQGLQALDYDFGAQAKWLPGLLERYVLLIQKWNKIHNLTAIRNPHDMLYQHVMDSLAVLPYIHGPRILDVGSGAGLPGIPLALAKPDWQVTLVESNQKKAVFLQQVKIELALQNIEVMAKRIEDMRADKPLDTLITRAFSELGEFVALTRQWATEENAECRWVAMKANCPDNERKQVYEPFLIEQTVTLTVPGLDADRQLIIIKNTGLGAQIQERGP